MTGDYCDSTAACCGGTPGVLLDGTTHTYGIGCDPNYHTCDNGQACNPPGNICGVSTSVNASQNCCDGKKTVCKPDSGGIYRCFGGCPNNNCSTTCPKGYDGTNPLCCIQPQQGCQFSDQCCNSEACAPDPADGMKLKCGGGTSGTSTCKTFGATCTGSGDTSCCTGLSCVGYGETGAAHACLLPTSYKTCKLTGASCTTATQATDCCSGICTDGRCADWTGGSGGSSCQAGGDSCTVDGDCCAGYSCALPAGATSGTCQTVSVCADANQSCSDAVPCCSKTDTCTGGICTPPVTCVAQGSVCTAGGTACCTGTSCVMPGSGGTMVSCTAGATGCACQPACAGTGQACNSSIPCCMGVCDASNVCPSPTG
jgi:hypothetical protein